jgi:hypothetical protein
MMRVFVAMAAALCLTGSMAVATPGGCRWSIPTDIGQRPTRWLGSCRAGAADGLGILRAGSREPYDFFLGRMVRGRPRDGLMIGHGTEWLVASRFDPSGAIVRSSDEDGSGLQAIFDRAAAAAAAMARRMDADGNHASARYYRSLADKVRKSIPE